MADTRPSRSLAGAMPLSWGVIATLVVVAIAAAAVPAWVILTMPDAPIAKRIANPVRHIVPSVELPPVEPVSYADLDPDQARSVNAGIPFATGPVPAARPFLYAGDGIDRQRAVACLSAAELYEAGDDAAGERAVAQVILNRVRHPAFPQSICGVVFQGSERRTGCQFTFTCDGALHRWTPDAAAWQRARDIANAALDGGVDRAVGYATHYHTDWVVPYWSASLDKIARVGTHLFFRWTGWWGTAPAFRRTVAAHEPDVAALALLPGGADLTADAEAVAPEPAAAVDSTPLPKPLAGDPDTFLTSMDTDVPPASLSALAMRTCGTRAYCKFLVWSDATSVPRRLPLDTAQIATMAFSYLHDAARGYDKALWNCRTFPGTPKAQCMKQQVFAPGTLPAIAPTPAATATPRAGDPRSLPGYAAP